MNQEKHPVTLEDLLRLKRAERPPAEFWTEFERELRTKQLAALLAKRPWWQTVPISGFFARISQHRVPLGAAAVVALTLITVRDNADVLDLVEQPQVASYASSEAREVSYPTIAPVVSGHSPFAGSESTPVAVAVHQVEAESRDVEERTSHYETIVAVAEPTRAEPRLTAGQLSHMIPLLGANEVHAVNSTRMVSAHYIAANLEAAQTTEALEVGLLSVAPRQGFESRALPAPRASAIDPLQQMTPPSDFRRSRYLTAMVSMTSEDSLDRTTARMAQRISGEELYEQVQRFGTRRGGLNVKF